MDLDLRIFKVEFSIMFSPQYKQRRFTVKKNNPYQIVYVAKCLEAQIHQEAKYQKSY